MEMKMTRNTISSDIQKAKRKYINDVTNLLSYVGETAVNLVRADHDNNWNDDTGALRSSVGYALAYNGRVIKMSSFEQIKNGAEGVNEGKNLATSISEENSKGEKFSLVLVAGMNYASYVQEVYGKDVLEGATLQCTKLLESMLKGLKSNIQ